MITGSVITITTYYTGQCGALCEVYPYHCIIIYTKIRDIYYVTSEVTSMRITNFNEASLHHTTFDIASTGNTCTACIPH